MANYKVFDKSIPGKIFLWILQFLMWFFLYELSTNGIQKLYINDYWIYVLISYLIYIFFNFESENSYYLYHIASNKNIYSHMLEYFKNKATLQYEVECYHKERSRNSSYTKVTHTESQIFEYSSCRDISGVFKLDTDNLWNSTLKYYIKLHLFLEIQVSEDGTSKQFEEFKREIYERNKNKDSKIRDSIINKLENFDEFNLVNFKGKHPLFIGMVFFILSIIFCIAEFYKLYVNLFCVTQTFTIKKIISNTRNLLDSEYDKEFENTTPSLNISDKNLGFCFKTESFINHNESTVQLSNNKVSQEKIKDYSDDKILDINNDNNLTECMIDKNHI